MKKSLILLTVVIWAVTEPVENDCSKKTTSEETNDHWSYNIQDPETLHVKVFLLTVDLRKTNLKLVFLLDYELRILEAGKIIAFKDGREMNISIEKVTLLQQRDNKEKKKDGSLRTNDNDTPPPQGGFITCDGTEGSSSPCITAQSQEGITEEEAWLLMEVCICCTWTVLLVCHELVTRKII